MTVKCGDGVQITFDKGATWTSPFVVAEVDGDFVICIDSETEEEWEVHVRQVRAKLVGP